jgi:hypothetical protein
MVRAQPPSIRTGRSLARLCRRMALALRPPIARIAQWRVLRLLRTALVLH